ncbi:MAG: hypothetical protein LKJ69_00445 [Lactobacillus sp.]|jgi:hypothetical protein|nr:hypothetical protein [Lactobacillus sp.]MCI2031849.1 hypothetical protein [Lactobacillus sp.]
MLDVKDSLNRLAWTTEHHFLHIQAQHDFMRAWAIQFELAYTDMRMIQLALQLANDPRLKQFTAAYEAVYPFEYAFVAGGLAGFNGQFGDKLDDYHTAAQTLLDLIKTIQADQ